MSQVNQQGEHVCKDYSSYGSGSGGADLDASEAACRANYLELVDRMTRYERALDVTERLDDDKVDIHAGQNTFIFNAAIKNGVIVAAENSHSAKLIKASYPSRVLPHYAD